jgi:pimeloyl-ACP methyl ester carboxylesterase
LASIFDYQSGVKVEHDIIQYLNERKANEVTWLETLRNSNIPTTLIWGEKDVIAPIAVADYVWTKCLKDRVTPVSYWRIPWPNHYIQVDQPELLTILIRSAIEPATNISEISDADCQPSKIR